MILLSFTIPSRTPPGTLLPSLETTSHHAQQHQARSRKPALRRWHLTGVHPVCSPARMPGEGAAFDSHWPPRAEEE